jgi:hypothetical protein
MVNITYFFYKGKCKDCENCPAVFMVHNYLWDSVAKRNEILCLDCFENRLERRIRFDDLTHAPCNVWILAYCLWLENNFGISYSYYYRAVCKEIMNVPVRIFHST